MEQKQKRSNLYQTLTDAIFGLGDWIISGQKERFISQFSNSREVMRLIKKSSLEPVTDVPITTITGIILIFIGLWAGNKVCR